jgi:Reverse transcriptase (RNA-dependent DNA polymerase)
MYGTFQNHVVPFGTTNASSHFQRPLEYVLRDLLNESVFIYMDDILIETVNKKTHFDALKGVFERMQAFNLRRNCQKCCFFQKSVEFLGETVSAGGIRIPDWRLIGLETIQRPNNLYQLRRFIGFFYNFSKFMPQFSAKMEIFLEKLREQFTKKGARRVESKINVDWDTESERRLLDLVNAMRSQQNLAFVSQEDKFILVAVRQTILLGGV